MLGQQRHRRPVAVHTLAGKHMRADELVEWAQESGTAADLVGKGGDAQIDALAPKRSDCRLF
jgi:hypothetical protein